MGRGRKQFGLAGAVEGLLDSATSDLSSFVSRMSSTLDSFEAEEYELTDDGLRRIFPARTGAVEEFDLLESLKKLVRGITGLRNDVVLKVKDYWIQGTAAAAALAGAEERLRNFGSYDWGTVKPHQRSSTTTTANSTATMSEPSASSSSPSNTSTPVSYMFTTKDGTDLATFQSYIKTLPDKGEGFQTVFPSIPHQSYLTKLTPEQAEEVNRQPFIAYIVLNVDMESSGYGAVPRTIGKRILEDVNLQERRESDQHLRVLSAQNQHSITGELPDYVFDPSLGLGQTIYVLDAGFNMAHDEFGDNGGVRTVTPQVVPNELMLANVPNQALWAPPDITDYEGHGTMVASVAGGVIHGVASNANLVLVKFKNAAKNSRQQEPDSPYRDRYKYVGTTVNALVWAWEWAIDDVARRRSKGDRGKFIINMSYGFPYQPTAREPIGNSMTLIMDQALTSCWQNDIITVVAAGNDGALGHNLGERTPQNLGQSNNALITVGGVDTNGVLDTDTTYNAGTGGSLTVYAVSKDVVCASFKDNTGSETASGTSFAAPAVAGLAAYFASLSSLDGEWTPGSVAMSMRNYITRHAYQRLPLPFPQKMPAGYPIPHSVPVAYNRALDGLCAANAPAKRDNEPVVKERGIVKRQASSPDFNVVVSGTIVVSSFSHLYCTASAITLSSTTSESARVVTSGSVVQTLTGLPSITTAPPPAPTANVDEGLLTCGTRTDQGNAKYWLTLDNIKSAAAKFCLFLCANDPAIVFTPGSNVTKTDESTHSNHPPFQPIRVSAEYVAAADSTCPTFDWWLAYAHNYTLGPESLHQICLDRLGIPINDCDTDSHGQEFWKQGGKFYRDCTTRTIESSLSPLDFGT